MKLKKIAALGAAVGLLLSGVGLASTASAEPVSNSYVAVGSDTLQDAMNALTNGTSASGSYVRVLADGQTIGNFDAFGSAAIQTKSSGPFFARPNGSGAGRDALRRSIDGNPWSVSGNTTPARSITGQVDIARTSSGAGSNANAAGRLLYVPFGRDAVAYAYKGGTAAWANITAAQLKGIYEGTITSIDGVTVKPRLPQTASGTRSFFLGAIAVTNPAGVADASNTTVPENDATVLGEGEIIPFSAASWVAQANNVSGVNTIAAATGVSMGSPIAGAAPFTGTAPSLVPNSAFYANTTFGRDTFLIVERARVQSTFTYTGAPAYDPTLAGLVNSSSLTSLTNFSLSPLAPGSVKRKFGFLAPSSTTPVAAYAQG
ncbi:substrate-binding domain-containing protein [Microbacterium sp. P07]|uniref:substrate-binding domain-containing protein n=1 Tax=Microbacterium sp. P07 TaxID=3366952 RepID=UPI0037456D41